ncbi:dnaJ protein homolog 1-like [Salvelinus fontinalis]|uniref:dnaJ protein homolog 1-like n=1 Tax=Salvelinus fontinalis TaxID=8038 RepID=UPI0024861F0B|nr:dnaJ protein homolog 1-like [Salvelinus fontinalis]
MALSPAQGEHSTHVCGRVTYSDSLFCSLIMSTSCPRCSKYSIGNVTSFLWDAAAGLVVLCSCDSEATTRDYYEVLGLPQSATDRQVKKAFHKLAMTYHLDSNKSPNAEKIFREIAEAYEVLSNEEKRYGQMGHEAFQTEGEDVKGTGPGMEGARTPSTLTWRSCSRA